MAVKQAKLKTQDAQAEYVVGGANVFSTPRNNEARDRVELRLTKQTIDRLRLDAEIESDVSLLFDSVLSDGIEVVSAVTDEEAEDFVEAQQISDFINLAISEPRRPFVQIVKEMGKGAFYSGVKVGEIVLRYQDDARAQGKLVLDRINPKPNSATAFVTDKFYNVLGLVGARREGQAVVSTGISLSKDEIIPREKFLVLSFELEDNDPRGLSQARTLVEEWCDKQTTRAQWKEWRKRCAIPGIFGTTAAKTNIQVKNSDDTPKIVDGVPVTISPQKAMLNALDGYGNNSAVVGVDGDEVTQLEVKGTGQQFERAIKYNDGKARKVILGDSLTTGDADKDSRAARESSKDVTDTRKQHYRVLLQDAIRRDIFRLLTVVNFGQDKAHLTPHCFLGDTEASDFAGDMSAYADGGYEFADEHYREIDKRLGFTPRGKDWRKSMPEQAEASAPASEETE